MYRLLLSASICILSTELLAQQVREINIWDQLTQRISNDLGVNKVTVSPLCQECSSLDAAGEYAVVHKKSGLSLKEASSDIIQNSNLSDANKKILTQIVGQDTSLTGVTIVGDNLPNLLWATANAIVIATKEGLSKFVEEVDAEFENVGLSTKDFNLSEQLFASNASMILKTVLANFSASMDNIAPDYRQMYVNANKIFQNNAVLETGGGILLVTVEGNAVPLYLNQIHAYNDLFRLTGANFDFNAAVKELQVYGPYLSLLYNKGTPNTQAKLSALIKYAKPNILEDFVNRAKYHGADKSSGQLDYIVGKTLGDTIKANSSSDFGKLALPIQIINTNYGTPTNAEQAMDIVTLVSELQL